MKAIITILGILILVACMWIASTDFFHGQMTGMIVLILMIWFSSLATLYINLSKNHGK